MNKNAGVICYIEYSERPFSEYISGKNYFVMNGVGNINSSGVCYLSQSLDLET